jgi:hypothetical protein
MCRRVEEPLERGEATGSDLFRGIDRSRDRVVPLTWSLDPAPNEAVHLIDIGREVGRRVRKHQPEPVEPSAIASGEAHLHC